MLRLMKELFTKSMDLWSELLTMKSRASSELHQGAFGEND